jgi:PAS domain S-box-containing protein
LGYDARLGNDEFGEPRTAIWDTNPHAWLAAIVDSSDDAIIGKTLDSIVRSWNRAAARLFGYAPNEIIGRPVTTLIPPELRFEETEIVARLSRGERIEHFETTRVRKDGTRIDVSLSVSPILEPSGRVVGAAKVARDITEARRIREAERLMAQQLEDLNTELEQQMEEGQVLQAELEMTNDELARSLAVARAAMQAAETARRDAEEARRTAEEANTAKSAFLATMSHELRTPLNAIGGYVELLELGVRGPLTPPQLEDLLRIRRSGDTLRRLIDDILNFAKLEAGRLEFRYQTVVLAEFLETLETFVAPRVAQKGLSYTLDVDRCRTVVTMDKAKVEQILLNLLSNAVKFTDAGGVAVRCRIVADSFVVEVSDTGPGIPPRLRDSIFEAFVQGDRSLTRTAEGAGLGLAISRQLARAMGGDVTVRSKEGVGSTFSLSLPIGIR